VPADVAEVERLMPSDPLSATYLQPEKAA